MKLRHLLPLLALLHGQAVPAALHRAATWSTFRVTNLLASGAKPNVRDKGGNTPLHFARTSKVARVLLKYGAKVNARNKDGATPLHMAATSGRAKVIDTLVARGGKVNAKNAAGITPLHAAVGFMPLTLEGAAFLTTQGIITGGAGAALAGTTGAKIVVEPADIKYIREVLIEAAREEGSSTAHLEARAVYAAKLARYKIVALALLGAASLGGATLIITGGIRRYRAVNGLIGHSANVHAQDNLGNTPLHILATGQSLRLGKRTIMPVLALLLIKHGGDVAARNKGGKTPYDIARRFNRFGMMFLLKQGVHSESVQ